jgi:hypothetical protein
MTVTAIGEVLARFFEQNKNKSILTFSPAFGSRRALYLE